MFLVRAVTGISYDAELEYDSKESDYIRQDSIETGKSKKSCISFDEQRHSEISLLDWYTNFWMVYYD